MSPVIFILPIVIVLLIYALVHLVILWLRLKVRELTMRKLSRDIGLSLRSKLPPMIYFCLPICTLRSYDPGGITNNIEGHLNGHKIHIYDLLFPQDAPFISREYSKFTVAEIDGIENRQLSWLGDLYLTPVCSLRKMLSTLITTEAQKS